MSVAQESDDQNVYCLCRQIYDASKFYIACDGCEDWFHGSCVNISTKDSHQILKWFCPTCGSDKIVYREGCFNPQCLKPRQETDKYCKYEIIQAVSIVEHGP